MIVENMTSSKGNTVPNQYIIRDSKNNKLTFQSYSSIICEIIDDDITLDVIYWDYSRTTSRYLSAFLDIPCNKIRMHVTSGKYSLKDLNHDNRA
jgi:hypothetical protein